MGDVTETVAETNRDRVRRLLLAPLGFRSARGTDAEAERKFLDGLADELSHFTDDNLAALRDMLRSRGTGSQRCFWPDRATVLALAEQVQPRPVAMMPALLRWFRSAAGPQALARGELVETFEWFERFKVPPVAQGAAARIAERASENQRRLTIIAERERGGLTVSADDRQWRVWYLARLEEVTALVGPAREDAA